MSDFFDSEIVKEELTSINKLQQEIYGATMQYPSMSREEKLEHVEKLTELTDKQRVMYTRLRLSDDPEAKKTLDDLTKSISLFGYGENTDMNLFFDAVSKTIQSLRINID
jgi:hypothetical protein